MMILSKNKGSFLIEAMIGIVLSSFLIIGALLIYQKAEENKRIVMQTSNMLDNAVLSIRPIKINAGTAGWGIPFREEIGCEVIGFNTSENNSINFKFKPLEIVSVNNNLDAITIISGGSYYSIDRLKTTNVVFKNSNFINLETNQKNNYDASEFTKNGIGYVTEKAILFEPNKKCTFFDASFNNTIKNRLERKNSTIDSYGFKNYFYNKVGGLTNGEDYGVGSYVYMMGPIFSVNSYYIENGNLIYKDILRNNLRVLTNNVVAFILNYGVDSNSDGLIDSYNKTEEDFYKIKTLSVNLIVKSPLKEKQKNGECIITKNNIFKINDNEIDLNQLVGSDWGCYRYRLISDEIELRNIRWTPKLN